MATDLTLLRRIDAYLDAAPRTGARTETIGPCTLFLNEGHGWRYYARPTPGAGGVTAEAIGRCEHVSASSRSRKRSSGSASSHPRSAPPRGRLGCASSTTP